MLANARSSGKERSSYKQKDSSTPAFEEKPRNNQEKVFGI
jgi:hypothetical protein